MKLTGKAIWSLVLLGLGLLVFVYAVSGAAFGGATPFGDVGLWGLVIPLFGFGGFGLYVAAREQKEAAEGDEA